MKHRSLTKEPPAVGDAVVVDGTKHRIRAIEGAQARIGIAGPNWRTAAGLPLRVDRLYWDPLPGVWRVG